MKTKFRILNITAAGLLSAAVFSLALWIAAPYFVSDPFGDLEKHTPVRIYLDRDGNEMYFERTYDAEWRFPAPLKSIPKRVIQVILAAEDADFYEHSGVDYGAVFRAAWQNLIHFRVVSGASTISMQLASMTEPDRTRSLFRKFAQAARARKIESLRSKEWILEEYLNRIPFGGKIYGIEAAARYYFGIHTEDLTIAETALLCGLPQRPNFYRPDRYPERARARQKRVLEMLERRGVIAKGEAETLYAETPRLRDFRYRADFEQKAFPGEDIFYCQAAKREAHGAYRIHTALDPEISVLLHETLRASVKRVPGLRDGAAVLIDNRTGETLALAGTLAFHSPEAGQVNAAFAVRTAGSVLKPFLYREAVAAGLIGPDTIIEDTPLRFADYMPGNADGSFHGKVSARDALTQSLNTPAVRLLARLGPHRLARVFEAVGLAQDPRKTARKNGLALTLGTAGHTLFSITKAYTTFTGSFLPGTFLRTRELPARRMDPASALVAWMLSSNALPGAGPLNIAWKTGTSSGGRDAWCAAFTPDYTLCVWMGNKNGTTVEGLRGIDTAAPCAGAVLQALYRTSQPAPAADPSDTTLFESTQVCSVSGLNASASCRHTFRGVTAKGIPLRRCGKCISAPARIPVRILSPKPGVYAPGGDGTAKFFLRSDSPDVVWFLDAAYLGEIAPDVRTAFSVGRHLLTAVSSSDPDKPSGSVEIQVEDPH